MKIPRQNDLENDKNLTRKHVAERNRRAKINCYLEEIEKLITPSLSQFTANTKLEKAEVLERTVEYIKQNKTSELNIQQNYVRGFLECIRSIQAFLVTMKVSESDVRHIFHGCLSSVRNRLQKSSSEHQASSDINIMTINNLNRLRNMESQRLRFSNKPRTLKQNENITTETTDKTSSSLGQSSSKSCWDIHPDQEVNKLKKMKKTPDSAFGVLKEVVSNNQENFSRCKDKKTDLGRILKNDEKILCNDNECENEGVFIQINEENIKPDINYDDPMWRPW
ncbi:hypothetical protein LOTGIDRAFT_174935 [Lottia gigantea]|uniref:BHLH domain-containing protein n=1 Tax=Lottia gigantea TaxID=225164 RepID=V3ZXI4_LOTGI|nr:hypothetical protein LOTGIDRAFT_174935 [Lottia gigantea]ESO96253.1 hypothetical protein LOTGIDRAFT_174935 [Lottia gigantea]